MNTSTTQPPAPQLSLIALSEKCRGHFERIVRLYDDNQSVLELSHRLYHAKEIAAAAIESLSATQSRPEAELPELPECLPDAIAYPRVYTAAQMIAYDQQCAATRQTVASLPPMEAPLPTIADAEAAIDTALSDALKAVNVLSTMLRKVNLQGFAVADEVAGSIVYAQKMRAALAATRPAEVGGDGWLPIESAPEDGTPILIAAMEGGQLFDVLHGRFEVLAQDEEDGPWDIRDGEPWCSYEGRSAGTYFCHWLPEKEWESRWKFGPNTGYTHWRHALSTPGSEAGS